MQFARRAVKNSMDHVKIILADIREFKADREEILSKIAPCYVQKYYANKIQKDAEQALVSGYLLGQCLGIWHDGQLTYNEHGKPFLADGRTCFNLSHSGDYVALAIATCHVGIDIEEIRDYHEATVKKVFSPKQKEELDRMDKIKRNEAFTKMWTQWEAMLKLNGIGFGEGWEREKLAESGMYTERFGEYYVSCAAKAAEAAITTEKYKF